MSKNRILSWWQGLKHGISENLWKYKDNDTIPKLDPK